VVTVAKHCRRPLQRPLRSYAGGGAQWVRNEDRGGRRGRGRSRHIAILGEIGGSEVNYDERLLDDRQVECVFFVWEC
jgi:hypothetical protein